MALKFKVTKRAPTAPQKTRTISWDEGGPHFTIVPLSREVSRESRKDAVDPDQPTRTVRETGFRAKKVDNVKDELVPQKALGRIILGWTDMKLKHIAEFVDPENDVALNGDPETAIPFSAEARDVIAEAASEIFLGFIYTSAMEFQEFQDAKHEELEGNSQSTSAGS